MNQHRSAFAFRSVLPITQLLICIAALWPSRYFLLFEIAQSIEAYLPAKARQQQEAGPPINIEIPTLTSQHQEQADKAARIEKMRMEIPAALNFPVLIAQLPYIVPLRREWVPLGMLREEWRVVSWPLAGIFFWWPCG